MRHSYNQIFFQTVAGEILHVKLNLKTIALLARHIIMELAKRISVFLQTIEHVDVNGCTGNLMDVLDVMSSEDNQWAYKNNALNCQNAGLISNHPLKVLMIPPEHRLRMEPILQALRQIKLYPCLKFQTETNPNTK
jgi:hypothetical protein